MNIKLEKNISPISFGINLILFLLVVYFMKPLLNSGDDAFVMYSLSGGFNIPPTELVDYSWGWHYILGLLVKKLFILMPYVNWYSVFLISLHWVSSSLILIFFLSSFRLLNALLFFAIYFLIFETTLLLSLNFSNTSIILAIAANVHLIGKLYNKDLKKTDFIIPLILIVFSGLLRFHTWVFVEIILGLFVFSLTRKKASIYLGFKFVLLIFIILLFTAHQYYYKREIPGWEQKEKVSQILYDHYNSPNISKQYSKLFKDSIEYDFFYNSFFYDTQILSRPRVKAITAGLNRVRTYSNPEDQETIYWIIKNGRLYFLILIIPLFFLIAERKWYLIKKILPFLCSSLIMYLYLFFFKKITETIFMGFLITNWFVYFLFLTRDKFRISRLTQLIFIPLITFCFVWGITRIYKINIGNLKKYNDWMCYYQDLKRNPSNIHIAVNSEFPIDYFSVVDNPINYPINNFISASHFNITVYETKKKQFGLKNITEDLINRTDVFLTGPQISSFHSYYMKKFNKQVEIVNDSAHYKCAKVYHLVSR